MEAILDNFLSILPPFVAIIKNIDVAPRLKTKPRLPQLPPYLHLVLVRRRTPPPSNHTITP